ncbi:MAG: ABC transporter ATP-binding protein [Chlorobium sp.]|nr:MAG: ABC transporter ATP-binding protein [Chlorobium sp.]
MHEEQYSDRQILKRLFLFARPYWLLISLICVVDLLAAPLALLTPLPLKIVVDSVINNLALPDFMNAILPSALGSSKGSLLFIATVSVVLIAIVMQLHGFGSWLLQSYTGEKLSLDFRSNLLYHAQRLSLAYHDSQGTSDAIYRIQWDAPNIQWVLIYGISPFIKAAFTFAGMLWVTFLIDWQLALVALTVSPIIYFSTRFFKNKLRNQWDTVKSLETSALSALQEGLTSLRVVKAFGQEKREHKRFRKLASQGVNANLKVVFIESAFSLIVACAMALGTALVLFIGGQHVLSGQLTLGNLLLVMTYLVELYKPLESIGKQIATLQNGLSSAGRALQLLDMDPEIKDRIDARPLKKAQGNIEFSHVSFGYTPEQQVISDISFSIPEGSKVGIVGRTGSGKTTMINLLTRFYDPSSGKILLDGHDIKEYKHEDLLRQFSIVLQEPLLFSTTIAENIAYGKVNATQQEIIDAARSANAHDFISSFPDGYNTLVGERGMRLSGGERQRISLARAFLKNAPILILDEPTSSVDISTETEIIDAMKRLMNNRTTLMIAHRLTTLEDCDLLLKIENGKITTISSDIPESLHRKS